MSISRILLISSRAPFRRGGVVFGGVNQPVEITAGDITPAGLLAVLREPAIIVRARNGDDTDWDTLSATARMEIANALFVEVATAAIAAFAGVALSLAQPITPPGALAEGTAGDLASGPQDAAPASIADAGAATSVTTPPPVIDPAAVPPAIAAAPKPARKPSGARAPKPPKSADKKAG